MKKYDIAAVNIAFKNMLSGPAPAGRILNYLYLTGKGELKHRNGNRKTGLTDGIGDAWCTEFMIGLGLVRLGNEVGSARKLALTANGERLFGLMNDGYTRFNEGVHNSDILTLRSQINACHPDLLKVFEEIFVNTFPFLTLKEYLKENGYSYKDSNSFSKDFFEAVAELYGDNAREAGFNRVPSLIQLCKLFGFVELKQGVHFIKSKLENTGSSIPVYEYTESELVKEVEQIDRLFELGADIAEKYGEDGTVFASGVVRNSDLQRKFKNNLSVEQNHRCVICGLKTDSLLIGSHIKPAAKCNVHEKADTQNGLLLCANHDKLFDRHLISFDPQSGKILIDKGSVKDTLPFLNLNENFTLPQNLMSERRRQYLKLHKDEFIKKSGK